MVLKKAYENIEKGRNGTSFPSKNNKWLRIKLGLLMQALPYVVMFMKNGLQSERECSGSMEFLAK
ncbi:MULTISPECIES: hypothetical protein [unclassified Bartonella]|uniref:hypothetical protein n=1 Tax=unclassified Bartonella TaxID=2645622 RepID=UPI0035CF6D9C